MEKNLFHIHSSAFALPQIQILYFRTLYLTYYLRWKYLGNFFELEKQIDGGF